MCVLLNIDRIIRIFVPQIPEIRDVERKMIGKATIHRQFDDAMASSQRALLTIKIRTTVNTGTVEWSVRLS